MLGTVMPQEMVAWSPREWAFEVGNVMRSRDFPEELAFSYEPRRWWTSFVGINASSQEGASRAHAIAPAKAPSGKARGGCWSHAAVGFGCGNTHIAGTAGPQGLYSQSRAVAATPERWNEETGFIRKQPEATGTVCSVVS